MDSRPPTSHERHADQPWDASYTGGPPPWDIGRPQPAIVRLASDGAFTGAVLDAGCGTGENALLVAALGLPVLGVDVAETAVATAREKAAARGLDAEFVVADALHLDRLDRTFDTVLDCGLFHTFKGDERQAYVASLASVTRRRPVRTLLPRRRPASSREAEVRAAFAHGWHIASLTPDELHTRFGVVPAWLLSAVISD